MRIGILGDLHLRASRPTNRIDDYNTNQFNKLQQAFDTFTEYGCSLVVQPGDFFNSYGHDPYSITYSTISFLMLNRLPVYLVFGQHDIKYHNTDLTDIPIQILNGTDLITRLTDEPVQVGPSKKNPVYLYGSSWDEKIPKVEAQPGVTKILVMHRMVIKGRKLWPGQTDYILARKLANSNFDLIVAGDNHSAFTYKNKVINCGSLMRMRVDQSHHNPIFGIYDTVENELSIHYYDIQPPELVLREEEFRESQANKKHQQDLVSSLNEEAESNEIDFRRNVDRVVKRRKRRRKVRRRTMDIVEESLDT